VTLNTLRTHCLINRIPHTNRYLPTENGLRAAIVLTQTHARLLSPERGRRLALTVLPGILWVWRRS
jgi:hypothetical protein